MSIRNARARGWFLFLAGITAWAAGCGGGGGASSPGGSATVGVSLAAATPGSASSAYAASRASGAMSANSAPVPQPEFDSVLATVTRIALLPAAGSDAPDPEGELESPAGPGEAGAYIPAGGVSAPLPEPVTIDLLNPPSGAQVATLLNRIPDVPAGEYGKIRLYYDRVVGVVDNVATPFRPTANYHFDVRFAGGNLVVPSSADPSSGIPYHSVSIRLVGLKFHRAGGSGNVLLRPQVFAQAEAPRYLLSGVASRVNPESRTFEILTAGGQVVPASYDEGTAWRFLDPQPTDSDLVAGPSALGESIRVEAIGAFRDGLLRAEEIGIEPPAPADPGTGGGGGSDNAAIYRIP